MTDIRADDSKPIEEDRLPWLEAVEDDEPSKGPSATKMIAAVLIGLIAIGLIVGGLFWIGNRNTGGSGEPELIAAEEGDYKIAPEDKGGMKVEGEGDSSFATSEGADPKGNIDIAALPEAPVTKAAPKEAAPAPKEAAPAPKQAAPVAPKAAPAPAPKQTATAPAAGGVTIQLGAFSSQSAANNAWKALSGRFGYLSPLTQNVTSAQIGGKTLYRLRASGPNASNLCGRLRVAGESCVVVN